MALFSKKDQTPKSENKALRSVPNNVQSAQPKEPPAAVHLENAMIENARNDSVESRAKVYQELLFSDLLLALADPAPQADGSTPQQEPGNINIAILSNQQGVPFAAAFTSAQAARRWRPENGQYIAIRGQDIFKLLEPSPAEVLVINPASAPFIVLNKVDYRQLAAGIIPQAQKSPVQVAQGPEGNSGTEQGMQISFPPDAFDADQKERAHEILYANEHVEAAAIGAILPQNAPKDANWLRTIFLRISNPQESQENIQKFCMEIRDAIRQDNPHFEQTHFEVGVMTDPNFWNAMHQNNFILFDKNPSGEKIENLH